MEEKLFNYLKGMAAEKKQQRVMKWRKRLRRREGKWKGFENGKRKSERPEEASTEMELGGIPVRVTP